MKRILLPVAAAVALGVAVTPAAHADVTGSNGCIHLPPQHAECVVAPQRVLCLAGFENGPAHASAVQGEPTISADTSGAVTWGWAVP